MTPEDLAFAARVLLDNGALDAYTVPIVMKKGRAGALLACMCAEQTKQTMIDLMLLHTSTIGVRETAHKRHILTRQTHIKNTRHGPVRLKYSTGQGVRRVKIEHDDLIRIANEKNAPISQIRDEINADINNFTG